MNQHAFDDLPAFASAQLALRHGFVRDLTLQARIGIHPHEREASQPIIININAAVREIPDTAPEALDEVVCYEKLSRKIAGIIERGHIDLVETLAETIADDLLTDKRIQRLRLRIEKPQAIAEAASVGVEIERMQRA